MSRKLLNPHQRNLIAITLRELEIVMRETVAGLSAQEQGILYQRKSTLSRRQLKQIEQLSASVLDEISKLTRTLELPVEIRDARSALQGQLAVLGSDLYDIRAEKLIAFGEVSPDLQPVLDPVVLHLAELVHQMLHIVAQRDDNQEKP